MELPSASSLDSPCAGTTLSQHRSPVEVLVFQLWWSRLRAGCSLREGLG